MAKVSKEEKIFSKKLFMHKILCTFFVHLIDLLLLKIMLADVERKNCSTFTILLDQVFRFVQE